MSQVECFQSQNFEKKSANKLYNTAKIIALKEYIYK